MREVSAATPAVPDLAAGSVGMPYNGCNLTLLHNLNPETLILKSKGAHVYLRSDLGPISWATTCAFAGIRIRRNQSPHSIPDPVPEPACSAPHSLGELVLSQLCACPREAHVAHVSKTST